MRLQAVRICNQCHHNFESATRTPQHSDRKRQTFRPRDDRRRRRQQPEQNPNGNAFSAAPSQTLVNHTIPLPSRRSPHSSRTQETMSTQTFQASPENFSLSASMSTVRPIKCALQKRALGHMFWAVVVQQSFLFPFHYTHTLVFVQCLSHKTQSKTSKAPTYVSPSSWT